MTAGDVHNSILTEIDRIEKELKEATHIDYINGLNLALSNLYIALSNTVKQ